MAANATMRAARIVEPGRAVVEEVPIPEPAAGQLRVRLQGCGVCASNLGPWVGLPWLRYPMRPGASGHEGWGVVDALGEGVCGVRVGDRVALLSDNAYAEYDVADAGSVVAIPDELDGLPCPAEALGCAVNIFARSNVMPGQAVAVVGVGFLGAILTRLACDAGARVIAISRRSFALRLARDHGADVTIPFEDDIGRTVDAAREATGGALCDRVIEAVGEQRPLDLAAELTKERGTLVIAGYHQSGPRSVNLQLWNWRGLDVVNAHERDPRVYVDGMRQGLDEVRAGRLALTSLVTHRFALEDLGAALEAVRTRPDGFVKAVVTP